MREEELTPLRNILNAYYEVARGAQDDHQAVMALGTALAPSDVAASVELQALHERLIKTVQRAELAAAHARGALGVVVAMRGLGSRPAPYAGPYSPPEGEDYIGT